VVGPRSRYQSENKYSCLEQFDYRSDGTDLRFDKQPLTYQEAFTCNLSINKGNWLELDGFNEQFSSASFEDIEFAYQAVKGGLSIFFNPKALAYHNHATSLKERCNRAISYSSTVPLLYKIQPEIRGEILHLRDKEPVNYRKDGISLIFRKLLRSILASSFLLSRIEWLFNTLIQNKKGKRISGFLYWKIISSYQLIGMREGIRRYGWN
jgi:GT2 family glycosyltransferase